MQVHWRGWGEGLSEAKQLNRPILLDISATWCHWCHVMDEKCYNNERIANLINNAFVPVRVDTDKRPDINSRYNMGGWPSTVFLTPEGTVIAGGTYIPPENFEEILANVARAYSEGETESIELQDEAPKETGELTPETVDDVVGQILLAFDETNGGFGTAPKFPNPEALELLLWLYTERKNNQYLEIVEKTLDGMLGIYDDVDGGFYRYAMDEDWSSPHYEKLLEVNAQLLLVYLHAWQVTGKQKYMETAEGVANYIENNLLGDAFYNSQDADERYYQSEKRPETKPSIDKNYYTDSNAVAVRAFLTASSVLERPDLEARALQALDYILKNNTDGVLVGHSTETFGLLKDGTELLLTLLKAEEFAGGYLHDAQHVAEYIETLSSEPGGFADGATGEGALARKVKPFAENCTTAVALLALYAVTEEDRWFTLAKKTLEYFAKDYPNYQHFAAPFGLAAHLLQSEWVKLTVSGKHFLKEVLKIYDPRKFVIYKEGESVILLCIGTKCLPPIKDLEGLKRYLT